MLKLALKQSTGPSATDETVAGSSVRHRVIPSDAIQGMASRIEDLKEDIADILKEEKEEKALRQAEMEVRRGANMVEHEEEIFGRPKREWFQSEKEKLASKSESPDHASYETYRLTNASDAGKEGYVSKFPSAAASKEEKEKPKIKRGKYDGMSRRLKRRKMAMEADEAEGRVKDQSAAIRAAKKSQLPGKITEPLRPAPGKKGKSKSKSSKKPSAGPGAAGGAGGRKKSAFDEPARAKKHEGMRAKQVKVNLSKKGKSAAGGKGKGKGRK